MSSTTAESSMGSFFLISASDILSLISLVFCSLFFSSSNSSLSKFSILSWKFCSATSFAFFLPYFRSSSRCSISRRRSASDLARYSICESEYIRISKN